MKRLWALLALVLATAVQASVPSGSIDAFIAREMPASGAPGLAWALADHGRIHAEARGEMLAGSGRMVTPDTPFLLGSISKSFTALAVMQLAEAGRVDLDAPIARYLQAFAGQPGQAIKIRELLSHTSGFSMLQGNQNHRDRFGGGTDELSRQVDEIARWTPARAPGVKWEYSNANYQILGAMIEAVSGEEYANYIRRHILAPVGMAHSFVADGQRHDQLATGHRPWFGAKRAFPDTPQRGIAPAGGMIASASDLARYLAMMVNGEDDILSAKGKAAMMRPASRVSPYYGFGWFVNEERGIVYHTGSSPGVETLATLDVPNRRAVVVLVNAGGGIGFGESLELRSGIAARALGKEYDGEGSRWQQKALFLGFALAPFVFAMCMIWAWTHRTALRAKSGAFGMFSLWFPLAMMLAVAALLFLIVPAIVGASFGSIQLFQPDLALAFIATAATGMAWAMLRLGLAYGGRRRA